MEDFSAKVGNKQAGDQAVGQYDMGSKDDRGELLVELAERNNSWIINKTAELKVDVDEPEWRD